MADEKRRRRRRRRGGRRNKRGGAAPDAGASSEDSSQQQSERRDKSGERVSGGKGNKKPPPTTVFGLPRFLFVLSVSVFVALLLVTILNIVTGSNDEDSLDIDAVQTLPDQGRRHLNPGETFADYNSTPPTSGPQAAVGVGPGIYDEPQSFESLLPLLERGGVVVYYQPDRLEVLDQEDLLGFATIAIDVGCQLAVTPHNEIGDSAIVATAWRHVLRIDALTDEAAVQISDFVRTFNGLFPLEGGGESNQGCDFRNLVSENEDVDVETAQ